MIVVFAGSIGRFPVGGHAWVDLQYLLGLRALGCEVYYLEECGPGSWVYHWESEEITTDLDYPTSYLRECLAPFGFEGRWIYRAGDEAVGMPEEAFREVCRRADLLLVRGISLDLWRDEYDLPRRRAFVDSDPLFTQVRITRGGPLAETVERCRDLFTVGLNVGAPDSRVPTLGRRWNRMLPPVALAEWPVAPDDDTGAFTSILQWRSYKEVEFEGVRYGNKDREFAKFQDLPRRTPHPFRMALTGAPPEWLTEHGWEVVPGWIASETPESYREFIASSRAELSVAKHGYVASRGGWISDRTACYLASGRPALVQDTGLPPELLETGGLRTFRDLDDAVRGVEAIVRDYAHHRSAARKLAEERFSAQRVLRRFLEITTS